MFLNVISSFSGQLEILGNNRQASNPLISMIFNKDKHRLFKHRPIRSAGARPQIINMACWNLGQSARICTNFDQSGKLFFYDQTSPDGSLINVTEGLVYVGGEVLALFQ